MLSGAGLGGAGWDGVGWGGEGADTGRTQEGTELMLSARTALPSGTGERLHLSPSWAGQLLDPARSATWAARSLRRPSTKGVKVLLFTDRTEVQTGGDVSSCCCPV